MKHNFKQKTALIMGGNSGIGKATAHQLLEGGATVVIVGRNADKVNRAVAGLSPLGSVQGWVYDITDPEQLSLLCQRIATDLPAIDYLVNASGIFGPKPFIEHTLADYDSYLNISRGLYFVTQQVVRNLLAAQKPGAIVNIGSMWAHQAVAATPSSAYSMAKSGLHTLTQQLAIELGSAGIRVNTVAPAVVATPVYDGVFGSPEAAAEALAGFNTFHPLGRIGQADDIASAVTYLLSDNSAWTTGATLNVDGGVMAGRN